MQDRLNRLHRVHTSEVPVRAMPESVHAVHTTAGQSAAVSGDGTKGFHVVHTLDRDRPPTAVCNADVCT